jgi:hypothetical protein
MAMTTVLRRMQKTNVTVHGFRSTFRDWAAERREFPREVAEMALSHAAGDKVETAYLRGDLFDKRRALMNAWWNFCANQPRPFRQAVKVKGLIGVRPHPWGVSGMVPRGLGLSLPVPDACRNLSPSRCRRDLWPGRFGRESAFES